MNTSTLTLEEQHIEKMNRALETILVELYDKTSESFGKPTVYQNEQSAVRWFKDMCQKDESLIKDHPEDFALYQVGTWNPITGEIKTIDMKLIIDGKTMPKKGENNGTA